MKYNKKGTSIIESLIVMLIIVIGITGMYAIFTSSQKLSTSSQNKLQAISIAREGIEGVTNIRDTNWINFSSNLKNCWMTDKYNRQCITQDNKYYTNGSYILYTNDDNRWVLEKPTGTTGTGFDTYYRDNFQVYYDDNGFFTQSGSTIETSPVFTREIKLIPDTNEDPPQKYEIKSIVRWVDRAREGFHEVKLETTLTNWKEN